MTLSNLALRLSDSILGKVSFVLCPLSFARRERNEQRTSDKGQLSSPVDLPQNHVDRANTRHRVRDQAALDHLGQGLQVGKRRSAHVAAKWLGRPASPLVIPYFPARRL